MERPEETKDGLQIDPERLAEVIATDDGRIKAIGEIFANDTSRRILSRIFEGIDTPGKLSSTLGFSLPLVLYHLKKLEKSGLIRVATVGLSSKLHKVHHYVPAKMVFVLIPSIVAKDESYRNLILRALSDIRSMFSILVFAVTSTISYATINVEIVRRYSITTVNLDGDLVGQIVANAGFLLAIGIGIFSAFITLKTGIGNKLFGIKKERKIGSPEPSSR